jgi:hypothetical protein
MPGFTPHYREVPKVATPFEGVATGGAERFADFGTKRYTRKSRGLRAKTARARGGRRNAAGDLGLLTNLYEGLSGYSVNLAGLENYKTTYGEVIPEGIKAMDVQLTSHGPTSKRTFYDLGCGNGKVVIGMALLHPEIRAVGYEIVPDRIKQAETALGRAPRGGRNPLSSRVKFVQQSFLDPAVSLRDAGWMYISNLCYDPETQKGIADKLSADCEPGTVVLCSRDIPFEESSGWKRVAAGVRIPMSWSADSTCNIYRREG